MIPAATPWASCARSQQPLIVGFRSNTPARACTAQGRRLRQCIHAQQHRFAQVSGHSGASEAWRGSAHPHFPVERGRLVLDARLQTTRVASQSDTRSLAKGAVISESPSHAQLQHVRFSRGRTHQTLGPGRCSCHPPSGLPRTAAQPPASARQSVHDSQDAPTGCKSSAQALKSEHPRAAVVQARNLDAVTARARAAHLAHVRVVLLGDLLALPFLAAE